MLFFALTSKTSFSQLPEVKVSVDKTDILIGQQIHYKVESSMADNTFQISWFSVADSFGTFVIVSKDKIDTSVTNGNIIFRQQLILTNFDSGRQVIPPLSITASDLHSDSSFTIFTDTIPVNVSYSPIDSIQPFHDIKPVIELKNSRPWWFWALIALGIVLLGLLIYFIFKRNKKEKETNLFSSDLSPYDEAMQSFSALEKEDLLNKNKIKEFHTRLTDILKRYLSRITNSYKLHLTADEILVEIKNYDVPPDEISKFANSLRMGNAVKFAKYLPERSQNEQSFSDMKNMVNTIHNQVKKTQSDI
jgi:hypothetical protein